VDIDNVDPDIEVGPSQESDSLGLVHDLAMQILRVSNLEETLLLIVQTTVKDFKFHNCTIYLLSDDHSTLHRRAYDCENPDANNDFLPQSVIVGDGTIGSAAKRGHFQFITNKLTPGDPFHDVIPGQAMLVIPIIFDDVSQGVIVSSHPHDDYFTYSHMKLLSAVASVASARISVARNLEKLERTIKQLETTQYELSEDRERYRLLFDHHPSMVFSLNQEGIVTDINGFALSALDYEYDYLRGSQFWAIHPLTERQLIMDMINSPPENNAITHWESTIVKLGGKQIHVRYTVRVFTYPGEEDPSLLIMGEDITDKYRMAGKLEYEATHDPLTGIYNRLHFENALSLAIQNIESTPSILCIADVNGLKLINDGYGQSTGDEYLKQVASEVLDSKGDQDLCARIGGDEFAILFHDCCIETARRHCQKLIQRTRIHSDQFESTFDSPLSIGICEIQDRTLDMGVIMAQADSACLSAMQDAHQDIVEYDKTTNPGLGQYQEASIVSEIKRCIRQEEFRLFGQKIISLSASRNNSYEALLRMSDDNSKDISTLSIIRIAERFALIHKLDLHMLGKTLEWVRRYWGVANNLDTIGVNISANTLTNSESLSKILKLTEQSGQAASKICLEITETAETIDYQRMALAIIELKGFGVKIAVDSFGSSGASFRTISALNADILKFDGQYIHDALKSRRSMKVLESMLQFAKTLNLETVAQRVENKTLMDMVEELGFDFAQGYFIHKPGSLSEAVQNHHFSNVIQLI
jgi:diguanylate cyclase (GGDEF)-like protein/PAS domain S-box-containing protein